MRFNPLTSVSIAILSLLLSAVLYAQALSQTDTASQAQFKTALDGARTALKAKDYAQAISQYELVVQAAPNSSSAADAMRAIGHCYSLKGDYKSAIQVDTEMLTQFPTHASAPSVALHLAHCYEMAKVWNSALDAYNRILEQYPTSSVAAEAGFYAGQRYWAKGDYDSAIQKYGHLVAQFPKSSFAAGAQYKVGMLYIAKRPDGKTPEEKADFKNKADAAFAKLLDTYPTNKELCAKAELQRAGIAFEKALDGTTTWEQALDTIKGVITKHPDAPKAVLARLELMQAEKARLDHNNEEALLHVSKIINDYSACKLEAGWARFIAGNILRDEADYTQALEYFRAVIDGNYGKSDNFAGRNVELYCLMGAADCYDKLGQTEKAQPIWQSVVDEYSGTPLAHLAGVCLSELKGAK